MPFSKMGVVREEVQPRAGPGDPTALVLDPPGWILRKEPALRRQHDSGDLKTT